MPTDRAQAAPATYWTLRDRHGNLASQYHRLAIGAVVAAALAVRKPGAPLTARPPAAEPSRS